MRNILYYILFVFIALSAFAGEKRAKLREEIRHHIGSRGESLESIAKEYYDDYKPLYPTLDIYVDLIYLWNQDLEFVPDLQDQYVYVESPYPPHIDYPWSYYTRSQQKIEIPKMMSGTWHLFMFATPSYGSFDQKLGSSSTKSQQNSPISLGIGTARDLASDPNYSFSGSLYASMLKSSGINDQNSGGISNSSVDIPPEIGANLYFQRKFDSYFSGVYGGFDFEKFSTLNLPQLLDGTETELKTVDQQMAFATLGVGFRFHFYLPTNIKLSYSYGIYSSTELEGNKFILYMNQIFWQRYNYHLFYKQHNLEDDTQKMTISRIGLGLGMSFF